MSPLIYASLGNPRFAGVESVVEFSPKSFGASREHSDVAVPGGTEPGKDRNNQTAKDDDHSHSGTNKALKAAGKKPKLIIYPSYKKDGHRIFFEVDKYWKDVEAFLRRHLKKDE